MTWQMRLRLKTGVTAEQALGALSPLLTQAGNIGAVLGTVALRDQYILWTEDVETQLSFLSRDPGVSDFLHTARYWHIRRLSDSDPRPAPLVGAERDRQRANLEGMMRELTARAETFAVAKGAVAVLDTNVLLEFEAPWTIEWREVLATDEVRLIIPLRVIEELDAKKYSGSKRLAKRARALLPELEHRLSADGSTAQISQGVTLQVPIEPGPRDRGLDADEEILRLGAELPDLADVRPTIVTADTGMRMRARAQGTPAATPPSAARRTTEERREQ